MLTENKKAVDLLRDDKQPKERKAKRPAVSLEKMNTGRYKVYTFCMKLLIRKNFHKEHYKELAISCNSGDLCVYGSFFQASCGFKVIIFSKCWRPNFHHTADVINDICFVTGGSISFEE